MMLMVDNRRCRVAAGDDGAGGAGEAGGIGGIGVVKTHH